MNDWQDGLRKGNARARELHRKNYEQEQNIILEWVVVGNYDTSTILEIGCGEFPLFNDSMKIDVAKVRQDIIETDCNLPFADKLNKKFDVIIAQYVVCHLWDIDNFFKECNKLLEDDGLLIISLPNGNYWRSSLNLKSYASIFIKYIDEKTFWRLNPTALEILAERYGFIVEDIKPIGRSRYLSISAAMVAKLKKNNHNENM